MHDGSAMVSPMVKPQSSECTKIQTNRRNSEKKAKAEQSTTQTYNIASNKIPKFAGPCAPGLLDPVIVPRPMSQGCAGLFWLKNLLIWAFLGTSAHESVPLAGDLPATCRLPAGLSLWVAGQKSNENPRVKRRSALHGRIWAPLEPPLVDFCAFLQVSDEFFQNCWWSVVVFLKLMVNGEIL